MRAVATVRTNHNFGPPPGREETIGDLPCEIVEEDGGPHDGSRWIYSVWQLSDEERQSIANGYNVRLGVGWIGAFPPVSLGVTHEQPDATPPPGPPAPPRPDDHRPVG